MRLLEHIMLLLEHIIPQLELTSTVTCAQTILGIVTLGQLEDIVTAVDNYV